MTAAIDWNPHKEFAQDAGRLAIEAPPCPNCANWRPTRQYNSRGEFQGVRLCQAEEMHIDFSCFKRKDATETVALP
jgi:hypothetical protein